MSTGQDSSKTPGILIYAPGRDGALTCKLLEDAALPCSRCIAEDDLLHKLAEGAGALLVAEESLSGPLAVRLHTLIANQPPWSDLPVLVVAQQERRPRLEALTPLGNVSVLTRPMTPEALLSAARAALRARERQFQVRDLLENQREQARRKDEFLAMLAHELRNPLAPIRYAAHALQLPGLPPGKLAGMATLVERQVGHMGRIIDQLLDVTRVTRGVIQLDRHPLDLAALARAAVETHSATASSKGVVLDTEIEGTFPVMGDETRLRQVLDNLIDNAVKFSPEGGRVHLELDTDAGSAVLRVIDSGDGIPAEVMPFQFEPFIQADRSLDRTRGGLGLGLALVKGLVQLHGGTVEAVSAGAGLGSTFTLRLPLASVSQAQAAAPEETQALARSLSVLVAEDNLDAAETLRMILEVWGFSVTVAHSGPAALETARRIHPDAVVCDIGLPGMSGYEVARALRSEPGQRDSILIAVTGYGGSENRAAALSAGFDEHCAKPIAPAELLAHLNRLAERRPRA